MKVIVIGATGTIGREVADLLAVRHTVVRASRTGATSVDVADPASVGALLRSAGADAVVCCAASAPLTELSDSAFLARVRPKLLGQVDVVRQAVDYLRDQGSITLTSGKIPVGTRGSAGGALVNAGLEAFVHAAAVEMPRGLRVNVISPGWVAESLTALGMDASDGTAASDVARAYVEAVEGAMNGEVLVPRSSDEPR
jgi:NAD(P)-dependent dehydrogenase (short-subunit alcohol dehydrogenase family)